MHRNGSSNDKQSTSFIDSICISESKLMREIVTLHIGAAGVRIGAELWAQLCREHRILPDGTIAVQPAPTFANLNSFCYEKPGNSLGPRAVFIDLESNAINDLLRSHCLDLCASQQLLSWNRGPAGTFARGFAEGQALTELVFDMIRRLAEACSGLEGFIITHNILGGTGSGFTAAIQERLSAEYSSKTRWDVPLFDAAPSCLSSLANYNAVLAASNLLNFSDLAILLDNEALLQACHVDRTAANARDNVNDLTARVFADLTSLYRYDYGATTSLAASAQILVPTPRLNSIVLSYAPLNPALELSTFDASIATLQEDYMLLKCKAFDGKLTSCYTLYKGNIVPKDVPTAYIKSHRLLHFSDSSFPFSPLHLYVP